MTEEVLLTEPYYLFAGTHYYPLGGWEDFHGAFRTLEEAIAVAHALQKKGTTDWAHVVLFDPPFFQVVWRL